MYRERGPCLEWTNVVTISDSILDAPLDLGTREEQSATGIHNIYYYSKFDITY